MLKIENTEVLGGAQKQTHQSYSSFSPFASVLPRARDNNNVLVRPTCGG